MDSQHVLELQQLLALEPNGRFVLDLNDVTFVDRAAVRFLTRAESARIQIVNCPEYVRSWMSAETDEVHPDDD
jgi:anti-anti-sigma regulatory factor